MQKSRLGQFLTVTLAFGFGIAGWFITGVLIGCLLFRLKLALSEDLVFLISLTVGGFCALAIGNGVLKLASK